MTAEQPSQVLAPRSETAVALWLTVVVLTALTVAKSLASIPYVGAVGLTFAAAIQLYLPVWRCERLGLSYAAVGLHIDQLRTDVKTVVWLCAITFPPFAIAHHFYMTDMHTWAMELNLPELAQLLPHRRLSPELPEGVGAWLASGWWLLTITATHLLGVALPEEAFYRGYLQTQLERWLPPQARVLGVAIGRAALVSAALFALGHFLGEWNPLRLGPFFPALIFAWLRNRTGGIVAPVLFHAACNVCGELLFALYR